MTDALIVDAVRTPFGRHGGGLAPVRPDDLAALVLRVGARAHRRAGRRHRGRGPRLRQPGRRGQPQRRADGGAAGRAARARRRRDRQPAVRVRDGRRSRPPRARSGSARASAYLAGGVESMSRAPFVVPKPSRAYPTGPVEMVDTTLGWRLVNPRMEAMGHTDSLGQTAENLAREHGITRAEQDEFALRSHAKAVAATDAGRFADELVAVGVPGRQGDADRRRRRGAAARLVARGARAAAAGVRARRQRHRRQLEHAQRRRGRGAADLAGLRARRTA